MRRIVRHLVVLLVYLMTPSAGEITENVVHLLMEGHTAHAIQDDAHQPQSPEHACSGPFHVCSCHSSTPFAAPFAVFDVGASVFQQADVGAWYHGAPSQGHAGGVFRPPIA